MKKIFYWKKGIFLFLIGITGLLTSCHQATNTTNTKTEQLKAAQLNPVFFDLRNIKKRGTLVAIVQNNPADYYIENGQPMGYEYEMLNLFAAKHNLQLEFKVVEDLDQAILQLNAGEADIIAHNLQNDEALEKRISLTKPHSIIRNVLVEATESDVNTKAKVAESTKTPEQLSNLTASIAEDVVLEDASRFKYRYIENFKVSKKIVDSVNYSWAVRKNAVHLQKALNRWIDEAQRNTINELLHQKYYKKRT